MRPGAPDPRATLRALPPGSLVLSLPELPDPAARRVALAVLEEAAAQGGGHVMPWPRARLLLGGAPGAAARAGDTLERLLGLRPDAWTLPTGLAGLEAWLDGLPPPSPQPAHLVALEARCAALPVEEVARLTFFAEGEEARPVAQRLAPRDLPLEDPDLRAQARALLCRRVLAALTDPAQRGRLPPLRPGLRLLLDLPLAGLPAGRMMGGGGGRLAPIALLPLAALAEPSFPALRDGLAAAGWRPGFVSKDPEALALLGPGGHPLAAPPPRLPPPPLAPLEGAPRLIALGPAIPAWCRAPGFLWELPA